MPLSFISSSRKERVSIGMFLLLINELTKGPTARYDCVSSLAIEILSIKSSAIINGRVGIGSKDLEG